MTQLPPFESSGKASEDTLGQLYNLITGDEDARVCRDIPPESCHDQPRNFFAYLGANTLNKVADELSSAKLVLPWMLGALGAPAAFTGFLVPIRESGVLLPQMAVAAYVRRMPQRKPVWLLGALLSALALVGMAAAAMWLDGATAGAAVIGLLVVYSLARGLCSVSAKDVLGKTVSKSRRGRLMGWSAAAGGVLTLALGLWLTGVSFDDAGREIFAVMLFGAAMLWLIALVLFGSILEQPGSTEGGGNALQVARENLRLLRDDQPFRQFVFGRTSMLAVALAPPFYVLLAQQSAAGDLAGLGMLVIASGLAAAISSPIWGVLGDRSSRTVMALGAAGAGVLGIVVSLAAYSDASWLKHGWVHALIFMLLIIMHSGVRLGRKVYLVDMANEQNRAAYVAVSNSVIGVMMLLGGLVGLLGDWLGVVAVIALLSVWSMLAAVGALRLREVSADGGT
ncbi:MAG: MFS transporter [Gammaproteobacteria bacterium]|nr:MFS transporter [Gammaproteobacteria bacterium]